MKDKNNNKLNAGSPVWMTTPGSTGNGVVVKINKRTCHVQSGTDIHKRIKPGQLELKENRK